MSAFTDKTWSLQPSLPLNNVFNKLTRNGVEMVMLKFKVYLCFKQCNFAICLLNTRRNTNGFEMNMVMKVFKLMTLVVRRVRRVTFYKAIISDEIFSYYLKLYNYLKNSLTLTLFPSRFLISVSYSIFGFRIFQYLASAIWGF